MVTERQGIEGNLYASYGKGVCQLTKMQTPFREFDFFLGRLKIMADNKELVAKLQELYPQGKITCSEARDIAAKLNIALGDMGELCDLAGIKICACELGCF
jgi:hypothetical protein